MTFEQYQSRLCIEQPHLTQLQIRSTWEQNVPIGTPICGELSIVMHEEGEQVNRLWLTPLNPRDDLGPAFYIELGAGVPLREVKTAVARRHFVTADKVKLVCEGVELQGTKTLADNGVHVPRRARAVLEQSVLKPSNVLWLAATTKTTRLKDVSWLKGRSNSDRPFFHAQKTHAMR